MFKKISSVFVFCFVLFSAAHAQITVQEANLNFVVNDIDLPNAVAGGLNAPQFSEVNLNGDDKMDLFVFDRVGDVKLTFVNQGTESEIKYDYAPEYIDNFPPLNDWVLLRDYNMDGVMDIFAYSSIPGIDGVEIYKGKMEDGEIAFDKIQFPQQTHDLLFFPLPNGTTTNLYVSSIDYPAVDDIDCDGDLDILTFNPGGGHVEFYPNQSIEQGYGTDTLIFILDERCWGGIYESGIAEAVDLSEEFGVCVDDFQNDDVVELRHAGSTLLTWDLNNDCAKELTLGDIAFDHTTTLFNEGTPEVAWITSQDVFFPSNSQAVDIPSFPGVFSMDMDNDGLFDFITAPNNKGGILDTENVWFYKNTGSNENPIFELRTQDVLVGDMVDVGTGSHPVFVDYNSDGLMDLVIGNNTLFRAGFDKDPRLFLYENTGTETEPEFTLIDDNYLNFSQFGNSTFNIAPAFGDMDNDGDLDIIVGDDYGRLFFAENMAGEGNTFDFGTLQYEWKGIDVGLAATPQIIDLNHDGLMDLVIGERGGNNDSEGACGTVNYFQNIGTASEPDFNPDVMVAPNSGCLGRVFTVPQFAITSYSVPRVVVVDGKWELFVGTQQGNIYRYTDLQDNTYESFTLLEENFGNLNAGERIFPAFADINGDDKYDMLVGNQRGGVHFYNTNIEVTELVLSSKNIKNNIAMSVFPNPAKQMLNVVFDEAFEQKEVELSNASGKILKAIRTTGANVSFDMQNVPRGIYFVKVKTAVGLGVEKVLVL